MQIEVMCVRVTTLCAISWIKRQARNFRAQGRFAVDEGLLLVKDISEASSKLIDASSYWGRRVWVKESTSISRSRSLVPGFEWVFLA
jgi:hypothetical protein